MGRITEMHVSIATVTMVMVNAGKNKYISDFDAWTSESKVNLALMGLRLRKYTVIKEPSRWDCIPWAKSDIYDWLVYLLPLNYIMQVYDVPCSRQTISKT